jgi:hypothetical protein
MHAHQYSQTHQMHAMLQYGSALPCETRVRGGSTWRVWHAWSVHQGMCVTGLIRGIRAVLGGTWTVAAPCAMTQHHASRSRIHRAARCVRKAHSTSSAVRRALGAVRVPRVGMVWRRVPRPAACVWSVRPAHMVAAKDSIDAWSVSAADTRLPRVPPAPTHGSCALRTRISTPLAAPMTRHAYPVRRFDRTRHAQAAQTSGSV